MDAYPEQVSGPDESALGVVWPSRDEFRELAARQRIVPVAVRYLADAETPISLYRKLAGSRPGTFLLESATDGVTDRYSFIGAGARAVLTVRDGEAFWLGDKPAGVPGSGDPMVALEETIKAFSAAPVEGLPPFTGGLVGHVAYDAVRRWEKLPDAGPDELHVPELSMLLAEDTAAFDHLDSTVLLVANALNLDGAPTGVDAAYDRCLERLARMTADLAAPQESSVASYRSVEDGGVRPRTQPEEFQDAVRSAVADIVDGEAFQIVVSQRFDLPDAPDPLDAYRVLRRLNPSPYMFLLRAQGPDEDVIDIVGASPESLVQVADGCATTHPIAGSRPRGATAAEDDRLAAELANDPKERSEHIMLVDLARNDLQRFCEPGTVTVTELMDIEKYSHIQHLVSTVTGRMSPGTTAYDALRATFPAGTLSGAPKPRAMQIIDRLEPARRGVYGGTVGYVDFSGSMDMAIAIRTAVFIDGVATVQSGGGIVADSQPAMEYRESRTKAAAMVRAISSARTLRTLHADGGR